MEEIFGYVNIFVVIFLLILAAFYGFISQFYYKNEFISKKYGMYTVFLLLFDVLYILIIIGLSGKINPYIILTLIFFTVGLIMFFYLMYDIKVRKYER